MFAEKRTSKPISVSKEDVERAFKSVEEFQKQIIIFPSFFISIKPDFSFVQVTKYS